MLPLCLSLSILCIYTQLSKGKTQCPFTRSPGDVQCVSFHPSRPFLFVATQTAVKVYHLIEQKLVKKLLTACKWISSIDMHPSGDHVIIGSYDRRYVVCCLVLSCLVLSCLVLSCLVLSCLVLSCLVLSCLVLSCLVLSCLVLS
jgi:WD40 repeat protein